MPFSASGYKLKIIDYAAEHGHQISNAKAQRLAVKLARRQARMMDTDLERIFTHSDPTPAEAIRNIEAAA